MGFKIAVIVVGLAVTLLATLNRIDVAEAAAPSRTVTTTMIVTESDYNISTISQSVTEETMTFPTPSYSPTLSISDELPIHEAVIWRRTKAAIPSHCLSAEFETAEARSCRTLVFQIKNDGFPITSRSLSFEVQFQFLAYQGGGEINPFGLGAQWDYFTSTAQVTSNITHLSILPTRNPGLVCVTRERFSVNFSHADATLRRQMPQRNASFFEFELFPSDTRKPQVFLETSMVASAMVSIVASLLPMNPPLGDVQVLIMSGLSYCMQPTIHTISQTGQRALFPAAEIDKSLFTKMMSNVILLCAFVGFHLISVMAVMLKTGDHFPEAAARAMFPSVSMSMATFLQPGNIIGGIKMMTSVTSPREDRGLGLVGILVGILVVLSPLWYKRLFRATSRKHDKTLWGFPYLIRLFMPESSWGPNAETHMWLVPLCCMAPAKLHYVSLNLIFVSLFAFVAAFEPSSPGGCAFFFAFLVAMSIAHAVLVLVVMPYRSRSLCMATAVSNILYCTPMLAAMARCFDLTATTFHSETAVASLMGLCYIIALLRSIGAIGAAVLEQRVVRHRVWPDRKDRLPDRQEEMRQQQEKIEARLAPDDPSKVEEVANYRPPVPEIILADPEADPHELLQATFGKPETIKLKRPLPKPSRKALKMNIRLQDPMVLVTRDGGLLPPAIKSKREEEYSLI